MRLAKVTLSADKDLIKKGKQLAEKEGTSLSSMFSRFLTAVLARRGKRRPAGPLTRKATGLAKLPASTTDRELLEDALSDKYGRAR